MHESKDEGQNLQYLFLSTSLALIMFMTCMYQVVSWLGLEI